MEAKNALDKIEYLRFYVTKNFFGFEYQGFGDHTMKGWAEYHCHTPEFGAFLTALVHAQATDFFEFFAIFKAHV